MEYILRHIQRQGIFGWLYFANLFYGLHFYAVLYINSSFLERHLSQSEVGFVFAVSSLLAVFTLASAPLFLRKIGNYNMALLVTGMNLSAVLGLSFVTELGWILVLFAIHTMLLSLTLLSFDIFIESNTTDENTTGSVRGIFLSMGLIAALFSPFIASRIAGEGAQYELVYFIAGLYLVPIVLILSLRFKNFLDPVYQALSPRKMMRAVWHNENIWRISMAQFLMRFFLSWYVVYMPLHLHLNVGFTWPEIGLILFLMLIPYVVLEYPAGKIADRWLGEKEILTLGFVIMGVSTLAFFWLESTSLWVWAGFLMATRAGAALVEVMTETHFFRMVNGADVSILSIFRMVRPIAYTLGPGIAGVFLFFTNDIRYLWLILAGIMLIGVYQALRLKDSK